MIMKNQCLIMSLVLVLCGVVSATTLVNIDLGSGPVQVGPAVLGSAGDQWNAINTTTANLLDSAGTATGITFNFNPGDGGFAYNLVSTVGNAAIKNLMQDYYFKGSFGTVSFSGIVPGSDYKLVCFSGEYGGTNSTFTYTVNGVTKSIVEDGLAYPYPLIEGVHYVVFEGKVPAGGVLLVDPSGPNVNGFQLQVANRGMAHSPIPANKANPVDPATVNALSWYSWEQDTSGAAKEDPNLVVNGYDVWFGTTEPNELNDTPVFTTLQSYPVSLAYDTTYYWRVDTHVTWDSNEFTGKFTEIIEGPVWRFTVLPTFTLTFGGVITTMDLRPVQLAATLSGNPAAIAGASIQFTLLRDDYQFPAGAVANVNNTTTVKTNPTATLTTDKPGTYKVKLAVSDGGSKQVETTVQVRVYSDACAAKKAAPSGWEANYYDRDSNCNVNVSDLAVFAAQWLNNTSMTVQATDTGNSGYPG